MTSLFLIMMKVLHALSVSECTTLVRVHLPFLVFKARHFCDSAFCLTEIGVPDKVLGVFLLNSHVVQL